MGALLVVEGQISANSPSGLRPVLVSLQVHLLVLDTAPQSFHEDVVELISKGVEKAFCGKREGVPFQQEETPRKGNWRDTP